MALATSYGMINLVAKYYTSRINSNIDKIHVIENLNTKLYKNQIDKKIRYKNN